MYYGGAESRSDGRGGLYPANLHSGLRGYDHPGSILPCMAQYCASANKHIELSCGGGLYCMYPFLDICANSSPGEPCRIDVCTETIRNPCECLPWGRRHYDRCEVPECDAQMVHNALLHEMAHCCGLGPDFANPTLGDCIALCVRFRGSV